MEPETMSLPHNFTLGLSGSIQNSVCVCNELSMSALQPQLLYLNSEGCTMCTQRLEGKSLFSLCVYLHMCSVLYNSMNSNNDEVMEREEINLTRYQA